MGLIITHDGYRLDEGSEEHARLMAIAEVLCKYRKEFNMALRKKEEMLLSVLIEAEEACSKISKS